jgi:hypothetical protein
MVQSTKEFEDLARHELLLIQDETRPSTIRGYCQVAEYLAWKLSASSLAFHVRAGIEKIMLKASQNLFLHLILTFTDCHALKIPTRLLDEISFIMLV